MPSVAEYESYIQDHCPKLYGRMVMIWLFNPAFREAQAKNDDSEIGKILVSEIGFQPKGEGFAACDEWEASL